MRVTVVTPPASEPLTLGEAKNYLRLDHTADDAEIEGVWIPTARELIERRLSTAIVTQTLKLTLDEFPGMAVCAPWGAAAYDIEIPVGPVQSVSSIQYRDANDDLQTLAADQYQVDTSGTIARIRPVAGVCWPCTYPRMGAVEVTYVAGDGAILDARPSLRAAMRIQTRHLYNDGEGIHPAVETLLGLMWDGRRHGDQTV